MRIFALDKRCCQKTLGIFQVARDVSEGMVAQKSMKFIHALKICGLKKVRAFFHGFAYKASLENSNPARLKESQYGVG
ncbi:hypothetical protein D9M70_619390 [compost metagenome]